MSADPTPPTTGGRRRGRPAIGDTVEVRLYDDQHTLLADLAAHEHIPVAEILRAVIDEGLHAWRAQTPRGARDHRYDDIDRRRSMSWGDRPYRS